MIGKTIKELLREKRDGISWQPEHISKFVHGVVRGSVSEAQAAAFLMAACTRGLSLEETTALTIEMAHSGEHIPPGLSSRPCIDKHSTGGVGDNISLILAPLAVACGIAVPMISGRGLGHTGGTVDKLESSPGFVTQLPMTELQRLLSEHHLFMAAQSPNLAPADRILYALRDVTGTVENIGLLTASILSKKLAEGLDGLVMDMKVGAGAFMETLEGAEALAHSITAVAAHAGLHVSCVFSRMDEPLGHAVGNYLELLEAYWALQGDCSADIRELTEVLVAHMLVVAEQFEFVSDARKHVQKVWDSGAAAEEFIGMLERQGGTLVPPKTIEELGTTIYAESSGYVGSIEVRGLALACMQAGAGRLVQTDEIDHLAGVWFHKKHTEKIEAGEPFVTVCATSIEKRTMLENAMKSLLNITTAIPEERPSVILQTWL